MLITNHLSVCNTTLYAIYSQFMQLSVPYIPYKYTSQTHTQYFIHSLLCLPSKEPHGTKKNKDLSVLFYILCDPASS